MRSRFSVVSLGHAHSGRKVSECKKKLENAAAAGSRDVNKASRDQLDPIPVLSRGSREEEEEEEGEERGEEEEEEERERLEAFLEHETKVGGNWGSRRLGRTCRVKDREEEEEEAHCGRKRRNWKTRPCGKLGIPRYRETYVA